jgi:O-antigen ligase
MINEIETTWASKILFFLLCAMVIFTTLAYGTVHQPVIAIFYLIAAIVTLLWAFDSFSTGTLRFNKSLVQIPLLAAFLYGIVQVLPFDDSSEVGGITGISRTISLDPFWTLVGALHFLAFSIFLAAFLTYIDSAKRLNKIVLLVTIFGFAFAFFAILQSVLSPNKIYGIYEVSHATPYGSFVNKHNFAAFMEMCIAVPLGLMFAGAVQKDKKLLYITAIALMGIAIILSGSRGGLVSLIAEIFFLILLTTNTKGYNQLIIKVGLAILLIATIVFGSMLIGGESSLTRMAETAASDDFSTNRTHIWNVALNIIKNNFIFGTGYGSFGIAYTPFDSFNGLERVEQAHNDYLQVLSDAGIVGLIIAGFFVFMLFRTGLKNAQTSIPFRRGVAVGALSGCFAILVHSLFDFVLHTTAIGLMFITLVALVVVSRNKFPEDTPDISQKRTKKRRTENVIPIGKRRETLSVDEENRAE